MLREGATVAQVCERLGVDKRSWYRHVHRVSPGAVRKYRRNTRPPRSISADVERRIVLLERSGLTHVAIAERVGVHVNTVAKYLRRAQRKARATPAT